MIYSSKVFSRIKVMITAIGTARSTPTTQRINAQMIMLMKMTTGLTPSVLFINNGISTLFSNRWINNTTPTTINAPYIQKFMNATNAAASHQMIGQRYGMNSVIAAMPASAHF